MALLQAGIPGPEQAEWLASLQLDPPEEEKADIRHALLVASLVAALTGKGQKPDTFLAALPWQARPEPQPPTPTSNALRQKIDAVMAMFGGKR